MAKARVIFPLGEDAKLAGKRRSLEPKYREVADRLAQSIAIADLVILHRARRKLTQQQLADRMGTSVTAISRLESGRHLPSMETLRLVGEALGKRVKVSFEEADR
jgi:DNA-binding XRE family transcriptional regulator